MTKKHQKAKVHPSFRENLKARLSAKNPILLFLLVFSVLLAAFYAVWVTGFFTENILNPVLSINAKIASGILNLLGFGTVASGTNISNAAFTVNVKYGCDAIEPAALFAAAVLAFPASFRKKIAGIAMGVPVLLTLNIARIISLFLTGIYIPSAFDLMHVEVWQVVFILLALLLWGAWIQWTPRRTLV